LATIRKFFYLISLKDVLALIILFNILYSLFPALIAEKVFAQRTTGVNNNRSALASEVTQLVVIDKELKGFIAQIQNDPKKPPLTNSSIPFVGSPFFDLTTISEILTIFVIADSLLSLAITYTMQRIALAKWRRPMWIILIMIWLTIILPLIELSITKPPWRAEILGGFNNPLTKSAIIIWLFSITSLLYIARSIFTLDLITYKTGSRPPFKKLVPEKWGVDSIDLQLRGTNVMMYYPITISADEYSKSWEIAQRFIVTGLTYQSSSCWEEGCCYGAIYFSFTRPPVEIFLALKGIYDKYNPPNGKTKISWQNLVIIDCYTQFAKRSEKVLDKRRTFRKTIGIPCQVYHADPRNPHDVNAQYEKALRAVGQRNCKCLRVAYDTISDFLYLTDIQIAFQYLRHNMVWENSNNVESLYLFRPGTISSKEMEEYFLWFSNGVLKLERKFSDEKDHKDYLQADFRGPFEDGARRFRLDFQFHLVE
jgi:hypothetical protein